MLRRSELVRRTAHGSPFSPDGILRFRREGQPAYSPGSWLSVSILFSSLGSFVVGLWVRFRKEIVTQMTLRTLGLYHPGIVEPRVDCLTLLHSNV